MTTAVAGWRRIGRSWLAMKTWVKAWLFLLNGVFLGAFAFLDDPLGAWVLVGYAASGPLLLGMMLAQGGLTRLLGLAHLVPWVPLLAYLLARLGSSAAGPRITFAADSALFTYAVGLLAAMGVCLTLDVWDVLRWIGGQRFVLGSREAGDAGASRYTLGDAA